MSETVWIRARAEAHMKMLVEKIGSRSSGSAGAKATEDYLCSVLQGLGYHPERMHFACMDWREKGSSLTLNGKPMRARVNRFSVACEVSGPLKVIGTMAGLEEADLSGSVVLLHHELTQFPWFPKNFAFYQDENGQKIYRLLEEKQPRAVLVTAAPAMPHFPVIEDGDFDIPSVTLPEDATPVWLTAEGRTVSLSIDAERISSSGDNVIVSPKKNHPQKIVLSAHLDTAIGTPGAVDNGTGVTTLLLLAESLVSMPLNVDVEWIFFNGEDHYQGAGEVAYLEKLAREQDVICLNINVDGVGYNEDRNTVAQFDCPDPWIESIESLMPFFPGLCWTDPWPQSDHSIFWQQGIPALAFGSRFTTESLALVHSPGDNMTIVDCGKVVEVSQFILQFLQQLKVQSTL